MNRLLESSPVRLIGKQLRKIERRFEPDFAKERDLYEKQQQLLTHPKTRQQAIAQLREKVREIIPDNFIPEESVLRAHEVTKEMYIAPFRRDHRAYKSDHDIAHQGIVEVGSLMGIQYLKSQNPAITIDEEAVLTAAGLHDTQRLTDAWESVFFLQRHGKIGRQRARRLMELMHVPVNNPTTVAHVEQMVEYHDVDKKILGPQYTTELGLMVAADRAAIGRLFSSDHFTVRLTAGALAAKRMRQFKNGGIASNKELFDDFTEILSAMDILVKDKIQKGDPKKQFEYVVETAKELGIVKAAQVQQEAA